MPVPFTSFYQTFFSITGIEITHSEKTVFTDHNNSLYSCIPVKLPFSSLVNDEYRLPPSAGMESYFLARMRKNVRGTWLSAVVSAVCSSTNFWPRQKAMPHVFDTRCYIQI